MVKAVCFSDTHKNLLIRNFVLPECDFSFFSGDCCLRGDEGEYRAFLQWYSRQPVRNKIFVPGNHDGFTENDTNRSRSLAELNDIVFLVNEGVTIENIKIYGTPAQPFFFNWFWNYPDIVVRDEYFSRIPAGLDVLITHCPPYGILDQTPPNVFNKGNPENVGCTALRDHVLRAKPRFHIFGHIHHSYGQKSQDGTLFVNASICTEKYELTNSPIMIDLDQDNSPAQC